ncbi:hypothetical protein KIL84_006136 [Mauremys mutica]|uniref:Uncharacterized protein n=1 Tax=Mauremys mutica TaxID=74926 RepID=A0A9D3XHZ8_9SAUR|nr:hypothetical protein KIL84_006136 [Mauremys mutica]
MARLGPPHLASIGLMPHLHSPPPANQGSSKPPAHAQSAPCLRQNPLRGFPATAAASVPPNFPTMWIFSSLMVKNVLFSNPGPARKSQRSRFHLLLRPPESRGVLRVAEGKETLHAPSGATVLTKGTLGAASKGVPAAP